jgi:hypothetical protein
MRGPTNVDAELTSLLFGETHSDYPDRIRAHQASIRRSLVA